MKAFEALLGSDRVAPGKGEIDAVPVEAVISPQSSDQVAAVVELAAELGAVLVARGGGSKLDRGNPLAAERVIIVETSGLDAPLDLRPDEGVAVVGAGVTLEALARALGECGKESLLDPLHPRATVGGAIAADPIGPEHALDRRLRSDLLGIEVVLAGGQIARAGGEVVKNVTGFDLVRLYCGSLGTLGVITRACVRLRGLPEVARCLARAYPDAGSGLGAAGALRAAGVEPQGAALRPTPNGVELVWRLAGRRVAVARAAERFPGEEVGEEAWREIRAAVIAPPREARALVQLGARPTDSGALCAALSEHGGSLRLALPLVGIALAEVPVTALEPLMGAAARAGWALFVQSAPLEARRRVDVFGPEPDAIELMRALKRRFDPDGRFAPGRFAGRI